MKSINTYISETLVNNIKNIIHEELTNNELKLLFESLDKSELGKKLKQFQNDNSELNDELLKNIEQKNSELKQEDENWNKTIADSDKKPETIKKINDDHLKNKDKILDDWRKRSDNLFKKNKEAIKDEEPIVVIGFYLVKILDEMNRLRKAKYDIRNQIRDSMKQIGSEMTARIYYADLTSSLVSSLSITNGTISFYINQGEDIKTEDINELLSLTKLDKYFDYYEDNHVIACNDDKFGEYFKYFANLANGDDELMQEIIDDMYSDNDISPETFANPTSITISKETTEKAMKTEDNPAEAVAKKYKGEVRDIMSMTGLSNDVYDEINQKLKGLLGIGESLVDEGKADDAREFIKNNFKDENGQAALMVLLMGYEGMKNIAKVNPDKIRAFLSGYERASKESKK